MYNNLQRDPASKHSFSIIHYLESPMKRTILVLLMVILIFTSCYFTSEHDDLPVLGMIAYYSFDGNVKDHYIFENHCTDSTNSGYVEGINGLAKDFNGISDFLILKNTLDVTDGLTFSFWLKSKGVLSGEQNGIVIGKYDCGVSGRCFIVNTKKTWSANDPSLRTNFYAYGHSSTYRDCAYSDIMSK